MRRAATLSLLALLLAAVPANAWISTGGGVGRPPQPPPVGCYGFKNKDARTATDLHFVFRITPDGQALNYRFVPGTLEVGSSPAGTVTFTPIHGSANGDGFTIVGYQVDITGLSIPTGDCVNYWANSQVSGYCNEGEFVDVSFTYPTGPSPVKTYPDWAYRFPDSLVSQLPHTTNYTIRNIDATRSVTYSTLEFRWDGSRQSAGAPRSSSAPFATAAGFTLAPGQSRVIALNVPSEKARESYITVSGTMNYTGTGGGDNVPFVTVHQEANGYELPGINPWGMLVLALILLTTAVLLPRRLRRA